MTRRSRHRTAWFVLVTMALGLLLPALAHAMAERGDAAWAEICTSQGMKPIAVAADGATEGPLPVSLHAAIDHCPWCLLKAAPAWAPPPSGVVWRLPPLAQGYPERRVIAPRPPQPWRSLQARGPPPRVA